MNDFGTPGAIIAAPISGVDRVRKTQAMCSHVHDERIRTSVPQLNRGFPEHPGHTGLKIDEKTTINWQLVRNPPIGTGIAISAFTSDTGNVFGETSKPNGHVWTARDMMLEATDTQEAPWYIVRSDDKRRARLNCIAHLLDQIPYEEVPRDKVKLPDRIKKGEYDDQATLKGRRFVAEKY